MRKVGMWVISLTVLWLGTTLSAQEKAVRINLLQLNDVYEMAPISGQGGLARVASLKEELKKETPSTFVFLAGDLVSPSAIGLAKIDGERIAGRQMIEGMNPFLDYMTFGNHEFDIKEDQLLDRIKESRFTWVSSNVFQKDGTQFDKVLPNVVFQAGSGENTVRIGVFSLTIDSAGADWVTYNMDLHGVAREQVRLLKKKKADIIIALTHLAYPQDVDLAESVPEIDLIMGGHEHQNMQLFRGLDFTPIFKADANARSAYIHRLTWRGPGKLEISSQLRVIDSSLPDEVETAKVVKKWLDIATESFRKEGIEIGARVAVARDDLDGREATIRNESSRLTEILAMGMVDISGAEASFFNSGSIRIDDQIMAGQTVSEYDILRILPFGGDVSLVEMEGALLSKALNQGLANKGKGGFLQWGNITHNNDQWQVNGKPVKEGRKYKIAVTDFLLTGKEEGLEYLKPPGAGLTVIKENAGDIRKALSERLKKEFPQ